MSLPPGFLDELRSRTSLSQVVGRKVLWDKHKSNQAKGDMWAPCPFHHEKTASFHVDDRKGFYYCFGCQAKGDAISFVKDSENVGFMEAVEILAGEAGMPMPARDPKAQEKADRRTQLAEVMEDAVRFYRMQLKTGAAAGARDYLAGRGLDAAALERFEIGFAPEGWQSLWDHLTGKGVAPDLIMGAGLAKPSTRGGTPYDVFRNRILFPIRDGRGRAIAFGGRAMDPGDKAKYLNSPETELFDKGRNLYNLGPAREAAGKGQRLVVAEGYMDVIALVRAGFAAAVAPLGTAVTESQLQMLWRVADEPIIALDGDKAGLRAAHRVIDLALPLMEAGKSLRFALMPDGQDPDDLIRAEGADAVARVLDQALPMVQLLWRRETEGRVFDSPERKAALDRSLRETISQIKDPSLRHHYGSEIKELRWQLFRPQRASSPGPRRAWTPKGAPAAPSEAVKASLLVAAGPEGERRMREAVICATLIAAPALIEEFEAALETMDFADAEHRALCAALLRAEPGSAEAARAAAEAAIGAEALETLLSARHVAITPCLRHPGDLELARLTVAEEMAKLDAARGLEAEIAEAVEEAQEAGSEARTWRLSQAAAARAQATRAVQEDDTDYETGANGALIDRAERKSFAELLDNITFAKGRNSG
ncbi:DNA primase [Roseivivax lentus]|uniref:DNA primase n=1 Tax=Roseivivax lentus TaxID=633194 RepID=A0A1N7Q076_9RHOB|nr:DNA primase [Roseivivax lentus]SIT16089.1 DNA primase [Roseivivax lentus]